MDTPIAPEIKEALKRAADSICSRGHDQAAHYLNEQYQEYILKELGPFLARPISASVAERAGKAIADLDAADSELAEACDSKEEATEARIAIVAAAFAGAYQCPADWKMVPIKLTARMRDTMGFELMSACGSMPAFDSTKQAVWEAMLAAAPKHPDSNP